MSKLVDYTKDELKRIGMIDLFIRTIEKKESEGKEMTYGNGEMPNGGWTPVSEGTPKENETVIASTARCGVYPEARYSKEYGWEWAYEAGANYWVELEDVLAWMPLPAPYEPQIESEE